METNQPRKAHEGGTIVIGGYGDVGRRVSRRLADTTDRALIIAGRRAGPAEATAATLGSGATSRAVDASDPV
ncbi:hypothetical protein DF186_16065, partial [Enterococcus hirae]